MFGLVVHTADIQGRDGAPSELAALRILCLRLRHIFADGGYAGPTFRGALDQIGEWTKQSDADGGIKDLPKRWGVECTFAWLGRLRRLAKY